jgi:ribosomal protein L25 (general stress protein Ctc)
MSKELKSFIKSTKSDLGKDHPTLLGVQNFHRRLKAAGLIAQDVFGKDVEPGTILALYEYLVKEEIAAVWMHQHVSQLKKKKKKESVIADAPGEVIFSLHPDKNMSN